MERSKTCVKITAGLDQQNETEEKERTGFEPAAPCRATVFKTVAIDHSATSPRLKWYLSPCSNIQIYMDFGLNGKVAMIAASSKGIGLATAKLLAEEGCKVSICGRNSVTLEEAIEQIDGDPRSYVVDVSNLDDLNWWYEQTLEDLGAPSIVITNTGGPPAGPFGDMTDEQWQQGFDSTLMNVVRLSRLVIPSMQQDGWGRIVHVSSLVAREPSLMLPISSTLRAGLLGLTRLQALEFAASGITVNAVLPGHTLTDRQRHLADLRASREGTSAEVALEKQAQDVPMKRLGRPEEIAAAIAFLCSDQAAFISGTSLLVDGGQTKGLA